MIMEVAFRTRALEKTCNDSKSLQRKYGSNRAKLIGRRLDEFRAADNLAIIGTLPGLKPLA